VLESVPGHSLSSRGAGKRVAYLSVAQLSRALLVDFWLMHYFKWMASTARRDGGQPHKLYSCAVTDLNRLVYIVEGCLSLLIAVIVFFDLPNDPTTAWFLNEEERNMMRCRNGQGQKYLGQ